MLNWIWFVFVIRFDQRRGLFFFHDGRKYRSIDALETVRALFAHPTYKWDDTPGLIISGMSPVQLDALKTTAAAVREVFRIPLVGDGGLTELGCADLLDSFRGFLGDVKKNGSLFPISPTSTEIGSSDIGWIPELPHSDSGSISTGSLPVERGLLAGPIQGDTTRSPLAP